MLLAAHPLWVADMTYVSKGAGFLYAAVVLDIFSRRIVAWTIGETMASDLVISSAQYGVVDECNQRGAGLIHRSNQGSEGVFNRSLLDDLASPRMAFAN